MCVLDFYVRYVLRPYPEWYASVEDAHVQGRCSATGGRARAVRRDVGGGCTFSIASCATAT